MLNFNWVDYVILAIFFLSIIAGLMRGFVREVLALLNLAVAVIIASMFANQLAVHFASSATAKTAASQVGGQAAQAVSYTALGMSYAVLFLGSLLIGAIISYLLNLAFQGGILGFGNRLMGGVFGLARGFLFTLVIVFLVQLTSMTTEAWWQGSQLVGYYQPAVLWMGDVVSPDLANLKEKFGSGMQGVGQKIEGAMQSVVPAQQSGN